MHCCQTRQQTSCAAKRVASVPSRHIHFDFSLRVWRNTKVVPVKNMHNSRREIMLVRHGRSALRLPSSPITAREFQGWIDEYNRTGLAADSYPPEELIVALVNVPSVFCSDYPRALESVRRLVPDSTPKIMPLFREAGRPLDGRW